MCARSLDLCKHGRALLGPPRGCETVLPQFDGAGGGLPWKTVFFGLFAVLLCVLLPPSAQCVLYVFVVPYLVRIEWVVLSVLNVAMPAAMVFAATLESSLGCFQSFESFDSGLGPHLLKLSGLALFAALVLLRLSVLHWNLDGEFFRLHLVSEKILVIGTQKGRNEGKGFLVQPSAILCRLRTLQVCLLSVAASCSSVCISRREVCCNSHGSGSGSCVLLPLRGDHCLWLAGFCWAIVSAPWSRLANGFVLGLTVSVGCMRC